MKNTRKQTKSQARETNSSLEQQVFRVKLREMYEKSPLAIDDMMTNFGLYLRGSALVKFLVLNDLYLRIKDVPGSILEFGCWFGQNLVILENLRAIYEPFNKTRQMVGFDTFQGYTRASANDAGGLLEIHEGNNVLGHIRGVHRIIKGDVTKTTPLFFKANPETSVALAYLDMGLYEPTKAALAAIRPHLLPGSVIVLDEFTWSSAKGEAIAFREVFGNTGFRIEKSSLTPMRAIVTIR
jgi:hypothetical protein